MGDLVAGRDAASRYVRALFGLAPEGVLVEVRFRVTSGMGQLFFPAGASPAVVDAVLALATGTDVFIGVLPRVRRRGRLEDVIDRGGVLWADCDTPTSAAALASLEPRPSMVVASGSGEHRHAYWFLQEPVALGSIERLNRRLALALGADAGVVTKPHTILRPPGSVNWKHRPPASVRLVGVREHRRISAEEFERQLPQERTRIESSCARRAGRPWRAAAVDSLQSVPPPLYFERLTGVRVGRSGKVRCPFHADKHPSLHVYPTAAQGWYCFACRRGGTIYDLASELFHLRPRGAEFLQLRTLLRDRLLDRSAA